MKSWIKHRLDKVEMAIAFRTYRYGIASASVKMLMKYRAILQIVQKLCGEG